MLSYEKIPVPCTYGNFHSTFSRIYNLLDHPSKDYCQSKYSRYNGIVLSTNEGASKDDVNHNKKDPGTGWLVLLSTKWVSWAKLSVNFCCRQNYNVKVNHCSMMPVALKTLIWRLNVTKIQFILITLSKIFFLTYKSNILHQLTFLTGKSWKDTPIKVLLLCSNKKGLCGSILPFGILWYLNWENKFGPIQIYFVKPGFRYCKLLWVIHIMVITKRFSLRKARST